MVKNYTIVIERGEDGWLVSEVVGLPGCHTQAKTMDQLIERTKEAIRAYLGSDDENETELSEETKRNIAKSRKEIAEGKYHTLEEVKKKLGM